MISTLVLGFITLFSAVLAKGEYHGTPYPAASNSGPYPAAGMPSSGYSPSAAGDVGASAGGAVGGGAVGGGFGGFGGVGGFGGGVPFGGVPFLAGGGVPFPPVPPGGPFPGFGPISPICSALEGIRLRLTSLAHPLFMVGTGLALFWGLKLLIFPQIALFATAFRNTIARMDGEEHRLDRLTRTVARAIEDGICLQRTACSLGRSASSYKGFIKVLAGGHYAKNPQSLFSIFKHAALNSNVDCSLYTCIASSTDDEVDKNIIKEDLK